jgi:hypothetical protein
MPNERDKTTGPAAGGAPEGRPASGGDREQGGEDRSFAPSRPGATGPGADDMAASLDGLAGDPGEGENTTSGTGGNSVGATGRAAGGDAHLGKDGRKLGDPMNARRQVPSSGATGGVDGGSGAD